jgi:hypothetical protein
MTIDPLADSSSMVDTPVINGGRGTTIPGPLEGVLFFCTGIA